MSEELKVKIPDGYRWVKPGEDRNGQVWKTQQCGYWRNTIMPNCCSDYHIITPIEPPKPEMVDVEINTSTGQAVFSDPNINNSKAWMVSCAPCIVGPEWAFYGFVWENHQKTRRYYFTHDDREVKYAKAVRFRRVGGAK